MREEVEPGERGVGARSEVLRAGADNDVVYSEEVIIPLGGSEQKSDSHCTVILIPYTYFTLTL